MKSHVIKYGNKSRLYLEIYRNAQIRSCTHMLLQSSGENHTKKILHHNFLLFYFISYWWMTKGTQKKEFLRSISK